MIREKDLQEAIAECQGVKNPGASTCIKLAAFYTLQEYMYGNKERVSSIEYDSGSDFSNAIKGLDTNSLLSIMDELMDALAVLNPRLYDGVMRKLKG